MHWLRAFAGLSAVVFLCAQAPAPTLMTHYRAYQAALEAGDLATAETEADAALQMSIARDGQGGRTGVLALNLAHVRLSRGRVAEAHAPALQAFEAAQSGGGVDPLLASLTLGRAELAGADFRRGRDRIMPALAQAVSRPELHGDAYNAAVDLGKKLTAENLNADAVPAWAEAVRFADLSTGDNTYARAEARIGYGIAQFAFAAYQRRAAFDRNPDTRIRQNEFEAFGPARMSLREAEAILGPFAHQPGNTSDFTVSQRLFAYAQAWRLLLDAYLQSNDLVSEMERMRAQPGPEYLIPAQGGPLCEVEVQSEPRPQFPPQAISAFSAGAVVLRVTMDETGQTQEMRVAAAIPDRWFTEAVERVAPEWQVVRTANSPANCVMPPVMFTSMRFYFRY